MSINAIVPLVTMACIGFFLRYKKIVSLSTFSEVNRLCFKLFLPALLFYNTYTAESDLGASLKLIGFVILTILIIFTILMIVVPHIVKSPPRQGAMIQACFRSNYVLLGMPIAIVICGEGNVGLVATAAAFVVPLFNFLSVLALTTHTGHKANFKTIALNIIKNPLIDSAILGLVLMLLGVELPTFISSTVRDLGKVATPLSIITLGGSLAIEQAVRNRKALLCGVTTKLLLVPAIVIPIAIMLGFRGVALVSVLTIFASPTAVSSYVMAGQLGGDGELAGELVLSSTVVAAFTMFLWIFGLSSAGLI